MTVNRNRRLMVSAFQLLTASVLAGQQRSIDLNKCLAGLQLCSRPMLQFVNDDELVALASTNANCFTDVQGIRIVAFSTNGSLVAKKPWPSTFPILTFQGKTFINDLQHVYVLDQNLKSVQSISIPQESKPSSSYLTHAPQGGIDLTITGASAYHLDVVSSSFTTQPKYDKRDLSLIENFSNQTVYWDGRQLILGRSGNTTAIGLASWVQPCEKFCQAYDAGFSGSYAEDKRDRILLQANGSRFPVTDAAGLFPYYRVLVVDVNSNRELYKKEFITRTGQRIAAISPSGGLLAIFDGAHNLQLQTLPQ